MSGAWTAVGAAGDVPLLEGRSIRLGARRIAVFRLEDGWAAIDQACPHEGGPLADGLVGRACVTCPLHGWRFDLRTGKRIGGGPSVTAYAVRERDGVLEVLLPAAELLAA